TTAGSNDQRQVSRTEQRPGQCSHPLGRLTYLVEGWRMRQQTPGLRRGPARQKVLDAAARRFYADGIGATGIDTITADAGVAKMSLYNNFASKSALVQAYLEARHEEWLDLYQARLTDAATPTDKVLAVFDAYVNHANAAYEHGFRGCGLLNAAA